MNFNQLLSALILLPTVIFTITALYAYSDKSSKLNKLNKFSNILALISIFTTSFSLYYVYQNGSVHTSLWLYEQLGVSFQLDVVSLSMLSMISVISFIILKYSKNYLNGDPRQNLFFGRLLAVIASVQVLVISGNLALLVASWVATSISLHYLLIFYKDRPRAIISARKKFIVARVADVCLLAASILLYQEFNNGELNLLFESIQNAELNQLELPAILIAIAALFKSAQLPFHSWLLEVMETPTPVSALLHAGLLNAGPFIIVRMAFVVNESIYAPALLITVGGLTALLASIIYTTQNSVKTALAYSSMGHMGFSLLTCGLGVYSAAMLHLLAHSFYKAHAFLSSGSVIDKIREKQYILSQKVGGIGRVILGISISVGVYIGSAYIWGIQLEEQISLLAIGAVITLGTAHMVVSLISRKNPARLLLAAVGLSLLINFAFFTMEGALHHLLTDQIPLMEMMSPISMIITLILMALFATVFFLQMSAPFLQQKTSYQKLYIHLRNGLYLNIWFDKLVKAHYIKSRATSTLEYLEWRNQENPGVTVDSKNELVSSK